MARLKVVFHLLVSHLKAMVRCQVALAHMVMTKPLLVDGIRMVPLDIPGIPQQVGTTLSLGTRHDRSRIHKTKLAS